jgi:hypothetical protein
VAKISLGGRRWHASWLGKEDKPLEKEVGAFVNWAQKREYKKVDLLRNSC